MILTDLQIAAPQPHPHTRGATSSSAAPSPRSPGCSSSSASLTAGMEASMMESALTLLTGHVNVGGFFKVTSGSAAPLVADYPKLVALVRERVPEVDYLTVRGRGWAKAVSESSSMDLVLAGVDVANEPAFRKTLRLLEGRLDDLAQPNTILLFEGQAERLKVKVGDVVTISAPTARGVNNTADLRVVVVAKNVGLLSAFSAFVQADALADALRPQRGHHRRLHVYLKDPSAGAGRRRAAAHGELATAGLARHGAGGAALLDEAHAEGPERGLDRPEDRRHHGRRRDGAVQAVHPRPEGRLRTSSWSCSMIVVVIGILNTLAIAIRERTREIGTLRAIGMQRRKVLWLFVLETALLGLIGTAAGALGAAAVAAAVNAMAFTLPEAVQVFLSQEKLHFLLQPRDHRRGRPAPRDRHRARVALPGAARRAAQAHHRHAPHRVTR